MDQQGGREFLETQGINLFHVFDSRFVADLIEPLLPEIDLSQFPSTVLLGNAGSKLWHTLQDHGMQSESAIDDLSIHPVDDYSTCLANQYSTQYLQSSSIVLYPSEFPVSLLSFGKRAGWTHTTPMGISIHPEFGTWFAFRALFLVQAKLDVTEPLNEDHPCESCDDKPCIPICPAKAVGEIGSFKLTECSKHRTKEQSRCWDRCLSRLKCPVGREYRYAPAQLRYHYGRSRNTIIRYFNAEINAVTRS